MTKERIEEIANGCFVAYCAMGSSPIKNIGNFLSSLPEFQETKWIKCSDRMPKEREPVFIFVDGEVMPSHLLGEDFQCLVGCFGRDYKITHWMPRYVPEPPVEEESAQIRELRARFPNGTCRVSINEIIEIVKRHEKARKE